VCPRGRRSPGTEEGDGSAPTLLINIQQGTRVTCAVTRALRPYLLSARLRAGDQKLVGSPQFQEQLDRAFQIVELRVLSNWGHPEYTCLYRFRVHGEPAK
jgi:hypothetical protein